MSRVVLLHAYPCDHRLWAQVSDSLVSAGHEVVTPDLRGFGGSPLPDDQPDMQRLADDAIAVLASGETPAVLGGCSIGGYVAMAVARRRPDLLAGLILADTKATADSPEAAAGREQVALSAETGGDWTAGMMDKLLGATTRSSRPGAVAQVQEWFGAAPRPTVAWAQRAMAGRQDSLDVLAGFAGPVLVICGDEDVMSAGEEQRTMTSVLRNGTYVEIAGAGHLTPIEDPAAVSAAIENWLATSD